MRFQYHGRITNKKILMGIKELLRLCDKEFVPPLSTRDSSAQITFSSVTEESNGIDEYYNEVAKQSAIVVIDGGQVVAFISFKKNYICEHISVKLQPNLYVTTIIVSPKYRNRNIAGKLYDTLIKKFPKHYIFTRTWSTNLSHIRILLTKKFHEHCVLSDDRGAGIDTNYYMRSPQKNSFLHYIQQYRLAGNITFGFFLFAITIIFVLLWSSGQDGGMLREFYLAVATSLMASFLCLVSDTFLKIRESKNDDYINTLKSYGISNLQFNKNELLEGIIPTCRKEIWISGCRLVMTSKPTFRQALITACKRSNSLSIKILATPPWTDAYKLIYGDEDVILNYLVVLKDLVNCIDKYDTKLQVSFSQKPLFSDTYKVDDRFITGPYLHCADKYSNRITAKDFFSLDITSDKSELYKLFYSDYMTLWDEAYATLDINLFAEKIKNLDDFSTLTKEEQTSLILDCCIFENEQ